MTVRNGLLTLGGIAFLAVAIGAGGQDAASTVASIKPNTSGSPVTLVVVESIAPPTPD